MTKRGKDSTWDSHLYSTECPRRSREFLSSFCANAQRSANGSLQRMVPRPHKYHLTRPLKECFFNYARPNYNFHGCRLPYSLLFCLSPIYPPRPQKTKRSTLSTRPTILAYNWESSRCSEAITLGCLCEYVQETWFG